MSDPLDPRLPPAPVVQGYPPGEPRHPQQPRPDRSRLTLGWVLLGLSLPVNAVVCTYSLLLGTWSLMEPGWFTVALVGIPAVLLVTTVVLLVRLIRRRPSIALGAALLAAGVLVLAAGRTWIFS